MAQPEPLVCPNCLQLDRIQKARSIVRDGTHTHYTRNNTRVTEKSPLAQKLYLNFRKPSNSYLYFMLGFTTLFLAIAVILLLNGFSSLHNPDDRATKIVILLFSGLSIGLVGLYYPVSWLVQYQVMLKKWQQKQIETERKLAQYNLTQAIYAELYYCYRCDGVFIRGSNFVPIEQTAPFFTRGNTTAFNRQEDAQTSTEETSEAVNMWPPVNQ